jgi:hypothetical protein
MQGLGRDNEIAHFALDGKTGRSYLGVERFHANQWRAR